MPGATVLSTPEIRDRYNHTLPAAVFGGKMAAIQVAGQTEYANSLGVSKTLLPSCTTRRFE
jgi:hypothetical protein